MDYLLTRELDAETKRHEMQTLLSRGNHQLAKHESEQVTKLLNKDVTSEGG